MGNCNRKILSLTTIHLFFVLSLAILLFPQTGHTADFLTDDVKTGFFISPQFSSDEDKINGIVYGLKADNQGRIIRITEPFVFITGGTVTALKDINMITEKELKPSPYPLKSEVSVLREFWDKSIHQQAQAWIFSSDKNVETDDARLDLNTKYITSDKNAFFRSRQLDADGIAFNCYLPNQKIHIKSDVHVVLRNNDVISKNAKDQKSSAYDVEITGDEMDLELEENVATIIRNVVVKIHERNETITCDKMIISMKKDEGFTSLFGGDDVSDTKNKGEIKNKDEIKHQGKNEDDETIRQIEFIGNVVYTKEESDFKALADNILYNNLEKTILMTCYPESQVHIISGEDMLDCAKMIIDHVNMVGGGAGDDVVINADDPRVKLNGNMLVAEEKKKENSLEAGKQKTTVTASSMIYKQEDNTCRFINNVEVETSSDEVINCNDMQILFSDSGNTFASAFNESEPNKKKNNGNSSDSTSAITMITCKDDVIFITEDMKVLGDYGVYIPESETGGESGDGSITVTCKDPNKKDVHCYQEKNKLDCNEILITLKDNTRHIHAKQSSIRYIADNKPNKVEEENDGKRHAKLPVVAAKSSRIPLLINSPVLDMNVLQDNSVTDIVFTGTNKQQVDTFIMDDGSRIICDTMTIKPIENDEGERELDNIVCNGNVVYTKPVAPESSVIAERVTADKAVYYQDKPMVLTANKGKKVEYENFQDGMKTLSDFITYDISRETVKLHNSKESKPQDIICNFGKHKTWSDELIFCTRTNELNAANVKIHYYRGDEDGNENVLSRGETPEYLDIRADSMDYADASNKLVFYGDVLATNLKNDKDKLTCTHMEITLEDKDGDENEKTTVGSVGSVSRKNAKTVDCYGSPIEQVVYDNPGEGPNAPDEADRPVNAKCDEARYNMSANTLHMTGHGHFVRSGVDSKFEDATYEIKTERLISHDNDTLLKNMNL